MGYNQLSGNNLSLAIAELLARLGHLHRETMQEGYYQNQVIAHDPLKLWITLMDGDELWGEMHANYALDPQAALTLTVEGWVLNLNQDFDGWIASYNQNSGGVIYWERMAVSKGSTPAEAICRARLALAEYLSGGKER